MTRSPIIFRIWSSRFDCWYDKVLSVTQTASQHHFGSGIEAYFISPATILILVLTKSFPPTQGRKLQAITVSANRGQTNIRQANLENATIKTKAIS